MCFTYEWRTDLRLTIFPCNLLASKPSAQYFVPRPQIAINLTPGSHGDHTAQFRRPINPRLRATIALLLIFHISSSFSHTQSPRSMRDQAGAADGKGGVTGRSRQAVDNALDLKEGLENGKDIPKEGQENKWWCRRRRTGERLLPQHSTAPPPPVYHRLPGVASRLTLGPCG